MKEITTQITFLFTAYRIFRDIGTPFSDTQSPISTLLSQFQSLFSFDGAIRDFISNLQMRVYLYVCVSVIWWVQECYQLCGQDCLLEVEAAFQWLETIISVKNFQDFYNVSYNFITAMYLMTVPQFLLFNGFLLKFNKSYYISFYRAYKVLFFITLLTFASSAPAPRTLNTMVSGVTTGLEVPNDLIAGTGVGTGAIQLVINVHTDSHGNIEVYTN